MKLVMILIPALMVIVMGRLKYWQQPFTHFDQSLEQMPDDWIEKSKSNNHKNQELLGGQIKVQNPYNDQDFRNIDAYVRKQKPQLGTAIVSSVKKQVVAGWKYTITYNNSGVTYKAIVYLQPDRKTMQLKVWQIEHTSEQKEQWVQDQQDKTQTQLSTNSNSK